MGNENRFKKLELRPGVRSPEDENQAQKTRKERMQELDRKFTLDSTIDQVLRSEKENSQAFQKKIKVLVAGGAFLCVVLFLASQQLFGFDGLLGDVLKFTFFVACPFGIFRWLISKPN